MSKRRRIGIVIGLVALAVVPITLRWGLGGHATGDAEDSQNGCGGAQAEGPSELPSTLSGQAQSRSVSGTSASGLPATSDQAQSDSVPGTSASGLPAGTSVERAVVAKLGADPRFLFGLGNDPDGNGADKRAAYSLGPKLDIHYMYLSYLDWPTWNTPIGAYAKLEAEAARRQGVIPMFTLYQAAEGGDGNLKPFATDAFMIKYWANVRVLFEQLGAFGDGAIVHVEPDFWGYAQKQSNSDPAALPVKVGSLVPECKDLPSDVAGFGKCIVRLSRKLAPKVIIGFSASTFGASENGASQPEKIAAFLNDVGAGQTDIVVVEMLDRDAGCFEAGTDPNCKRGGSFYWDETNVSHPNFHDHLAWTKTIHEKTGKPLLWWQLPLGAPSGSPGTAGKYRDNRVKYVFSHVDELVAAGGIGAVFGTGAGNQTTVKSDGGQFKTALSKYLAAPAPLR